MTEGPVFRTISRSRRRIRFRSTALPVFFVTVKPTRAGPWSSRARACKTNGAAGTLLPVAAARKSARCFNLSMQAADPAGAASGAKLFTAARAARIENLAAAFGGHAGTKSVTALAYQFARLICPLHERSPLIAPWRGEICGLQRRQNPR